VSPVYNIPALTTAQPLADTTGPLDPGKYVVTLTANNGLGIVSSIERVVTIP
jgi:hypothetical protein